MSVVGAPTSSAQQTCTVVFMRHLTVLVAAHAHARLHCNNTEIIEQFGNDFRIAHSRGAVGFIEEKTCYCSSDD